MTTYVGQADFFEVVVRVPDAQHVPDRVGVVRVDGDRVSLMNPPSFL